MERRPHFGPDHRMLVLHRIASGPEMRRGRFAGLCGACARQREAGGPDMNRSHPPNRYVEPAQQPVRGTLVRAGPEVPGIADLDRAQADIPHILALGFTGAIAFIILVEGNGDLAGKIVALGNNAVVSA